MACQHCSGMEAITAICQPCGHGLCSTCLEASPPRLLARLCGLCGEPVQQAVGGLDGKKILLAPMNSKHAEAVALSATIPDDIWAGAFICSAGYLDSEGTHAKLPLGHAMRLVPGDCANPLEFAERVACMLKFYGCLSEEVAQSFGSILDACNARASSIMSADTSALPGFVVPSTAAWKHEVPACDPADLGITVSTKLLEQADKFSRKLWRRPFQSLILNDRAFALHCTQMPPIPEVSKRTSWESARRAELKRTLRQTVEHINKLSATGDDNHEAIKELLTSFNDLARSSQVLHAYKRQRVDDTCTPQALGSAGILGAAPWMPAPTVEQVKEREGRLPYSL